MSKVATTISKQKATGAHFTPPELASFVARQILASSSISEKNHVRILDPSCGDGELLLAIASEMDSQLLKKVTIIGIESDTESIKSAESRLKKMNVPNLEMIEGDFLEISQSSSQSQLFLGMGEPSQQIEPVDIVIANPPYVRTQILGSTRAQKLAQEYSLKGRVDLYQVFLVAMSSQLVPGGVLGVITSNRFLSTKGGASIRQYLHNEFNISSIFDLGDTKLFSAAVLPAVFVGKKKTTSKGERPDYQPRFVRIYERQSPNSDLFRQKRSANSVIDAIENQDTGGWIVGGKYYDVSSGTLQIPLVSSDPWMMVTDTEREWIECINKNSHCRISDIAKVRVGVKTTADKVFIREKWSDLKEEYTPEDELLYSLLSHDSADKWKRQVETELKDILYPHHKIDGKRVPISLQQFPGAANYLRHHESDLRKRKYVTAAGRKWYEIWVPQDPEAWKYPKIVFPDISPSPKFFLDTDGCIVDGNCYWITLESAPLDDTLLLILGIANSEIMTKYHDLSFNNKLYAGRRRYLTQYVEKYPVPDPNSAYSKIIIEAVRRILELDSTSQRNILEREIEQNLKKAFGL